MILIAMMKIERILPRVLWCVSLRSRLGCDLDSQFLVFNLQGSPRSCHERSQWRLPVLFSDSASCVLYGPPVAILFSLLFINPCVPGCSLTLVSLRDVFCPCISGYVGQNTFYLPFTEKSRRVHPICSPPPFKSTACTYTICFL